MGALVGFQDIGSAEVFTAVVAGVDLSTAVGFHVGVERGCSDKRFRTGGTAQ